MSPAVVTRSQLGSDELMSRRKVLEDLEAIRDVVRANGKPQCRLVVTTSPVERFLGSEDRSGRLAWLRIVLPAVFTAAADQ